MKKIAMLQILFALFFSNAFFCCNQHKQSNKDVNKVKANDLNNNVIIESIKVLKGDQIKKTTITKDTAEYVLKLDVRSNDPNAYFVYINKDSVYMDVGFEHFYMDGNYSFGRVNFPVSPEYHKRVYLGKESVSLYYPFNFNKSIDSTVYKMYYQDIEDSLNTSLYFKFKIFPSYNQPKVEFLY